MLNVHARFCDTSGEDTPCGCGPIPGVLWPWATDGDREHDWIERCDECRVYPDDETAAQALGAHLGRRVGHAYIPSVDRGAPYIDNVGAR